jgi:hypothetical protein
MSLRLFGLAASIALVAGWTGRPATAPLSRSTTYTVRMNGAQETPANNTKGTGSATLTLDGTKLKYSIDVKDLSGPAAAAHIHVGAVGVAGPPVYTFTVTAASSGTISEGTIDLTTDASSGVSGDSLTKLLRNGNAYVNVHTKNFPAGEIRGQAIKKQ